MFQKKMPVMPPLPCPHYAGGCFCPDCMKAQRYEAEQRLKASRSESLPMDAMR
jgi:hypothetical protein